MTYSFADALGAAGAAAAFGPLWLLPGFAFAFAANALGVRKADPLRACAVALVSAYAALPIILDWVTRAAGLSAALVVLCGLAVLGFLLIKRFSEPLPWVVTWVSAAWLAFMLLVWVDADLGGRLYPSLLMIDTVKHAATVNAILATGAVPPVDPFFLRAEPAGYYYYFYLAPALLVKLTSGIIDARAAVAGQIFWTGCGLIAVASLILERASFTGHKGSACRFMVVVACCTGLGMVTVLIAYAATGTWVGQTGWVSGQVQAWPELTLWVPHHVAALIASWAGMLVLTDQNVRTASVCVAGLAFASALGMSVWVAAGAVATMALWLALLVLDRRWVRSSLVCLAGLIAVALSLPFLWDLMAGRTDAASAIGFVIRPFFLLDVVTGSGWTQEIGRVAGLPLNIVLAYGIMAIGTAGFWRRQGWRGGTASDTARVLMISAVATLIIGSFLGSTIRNNDLGWRVPLFAQLAAMIWTATWLQAVWAERSNISSSRSATRVFAATAAAALVGCAGALYDAVMLRAYPALHVFGVADIHARDAGIDREVRSAYDWLARNEATGVVVQHNPDHERVFGYSLYGTNRVAISDRHNSRLFGAAARDVEARLAELIPVFGDPLSATAARARLTKHGVDVVVVTAEDRAWGSPNSWVWTSPALYVSPHVRAISVRRLTP